MHTKNDPQKCKKIRDLAMVMILRETYNTAVSWSQL